MDQTNESRRMLKEMYGFEQWHRGGGGTEKRGAPRALTSKELPLPLINRYPLGGGGHLDTYGDGKVTLVTVYVHPFKEPDKAHEAMIDHLLGCSAPHPLPKADSKGLATGDVSFAGLDDPVTSLSFVRDNYLVRIHSVGETPYPLKAFSASIDALITAGH
ncbi:MAG: hypothetical protein HQL63_02875 [Magnetococcales bacterium]|nr:hypothetical protein [Magnetococcales bacterium]MBF0321591.1 hypothetical protein [Magnetococcales bacterium]